MSDDIVTRLRLLNEGTQSTYLMFAEAADEIERLRAEIMEINILWNMDKAKLETYRA